MRRKFTVYGLRFSKTSFWNRINTGFLDPAVATAPTACGIETGTGDRLWDKKSLLLQQHLPLAVLKPKTAATKLLHSVELQQHLPLAVLKLHLVESFNNVLNKLQQHLPLAVLKPTATH